MAASAARGRHRSRTAAAWLAWLHAPWLVLSVAVHAAVLTPLLLGPGLPGRPASPPAVTLEPAAQAPPPMATPGPLPEPVAEAVAPPAPLPEPGLVEQPAPLLPLPVDTTPAAADLDRVLAAPAHDNPWTRVVAPGTAPTGRYAGRRFGLGSLGASPAGRATAKAIQDGLEWLRRHQDDDGRFDADGFMQHDTGLPCDGAGSPTQDIGVTALALLAFLGDGSTLRGGPDSAAIKRSVRWLRQQQQDNGLFGTRAANDFIYGHAIATYAMCEAYGLSDSRSLRPCVQLAVDYLVAHRNPYGAWRYQPRDGQSDTSVTGWCVLALESARHFQLVVDADALAWSARWFDQATDERGRTGYTAPGEASSRQPGKHSTRFPADAGETLTAVALMCRFFLDQEPRHKPVMRQAADLILQKPPEWNPAAGKVDFCYWFYASYALFQMGGHWWADWQRALTGAALAQQRRDGSFAGSWDPIDPWGEDGGRVYATAMLVLTLQAHYRFTRLH